jgi:translation initiation factor IF-2
MPKKIFELASQLGVGALDLVEKIKSMGFNVRNHMSVLSDEELAKVMILLSEEKDKTKSKDLPKKKVAALKKVTKKSTLASGDSDSDLASRVEEEVSVSATSKVSKITGESKIQKADVGNVPLKAGAELNSKTQASKATLKEGVKSKKAVLRRKAQDIGHDQSGEAHSEEHFGSEDGYSHEGVNTDGSSYEEETFHAHSEADKIQESQHQEEITHSTETLSADESTSHDEEFSDNIKNSPQQSEPLKIQPTHTGERAPEETNLEVQQSESVSSSILKPSSLPAQKAKSSGDFPELRGLQVVYRPEPKKVAPVEPPAAAASAKAVSSKVAETQNVEVSGGKETLPADRGSKIKEKVYFEEKMHTFTPIYTPPKPPPSAPSARGGSGQSGSGSASGRIGGGPNSTGLSQTGHLGAKTTQKPQGPGSPSTPGGDFDFDKLDPKKRIGELASLVAKPKLKVKDVTQIRADEELKQYNLVTGGGVGKIIYSNPGKKKIFNGFTKGTEKTELKESKRVIDAHWGLLAQDLAQKLSLKFDELKDRALELNLLLRNDDFLGIKLLDKIAALYKFRVVNSAFDESKIFDVDSDKENDVEAEVANRSASEAKSPLNSKGTSSDIKVDEKKSQSAKNNKNQKQNSSSDAAHALEATKETLKDATKEIKEGQHRSPVVTIMGHVDHGKTTLLDFIRSTKVVDTEAGGITQHMAAYMVNHDGKWVTFIDTPGHAAFGSMRERGANVTDIVVLVVAADDGVMPQTKESILICKSAGVPIIVAINKMDKPGVNPDRIKQELMEFQLTPEEWGGDTQFVPISALKGTGVDDLLASIGVQAEMMELKAKSKGAAQGVVLESRIEVGRGPMVTVLVQQGCLKASDIVVVGENYGRARSIMDFAGKPLKEAGPSVPVQILGLDGTPNPGDKLVVVKNDREAKKIVENRINNRKILESAPVKKKMTLEDFFNTGAQEGDKKVLKLIVRTDVAGTYEAINRSLNSLGNNEVGVSIIGGGTGAITDSDVQLASTSGGLILGFNMRPMTSAQRMAEEKGVEIKTYRIIYDLIDEVKLALEGMLAPNQVEKYIGRAEVRNTFNIPKIGVIAGSAVIDGKIERGCKIRLLRDGKILHDGKLSSLKRFKDDVKEVKTGFECGISLEGFNNIQVNDIFEAYILEEKRRTLESAAGQTAGQSSSASVS